MLQLTAGVEGEERLLRELNGFAGDLEKPIRPVARPLSDEVLSMVRGQFRSRGGRGPSGQWPANKPSTIAGYVAQNRKGYRVINEPMRRSDALFIATTTRGGPHGVYDVQDDSLTMGAGGEVGRYGSIHQRKRRKVYDPTDEDARKFVRVIKNGLRAKIVERGFDYVDRGEIPF